VEATKPSEPLMYRTALGGSASRQAATRVNTEQTSKRKMWEPTRAKGRGRPPSLRGYDASEVPQRSHRGIGGGMSVQGNLTQHGKPQR